jgi:predicted acylesterase/phospholipase RssA
MKLTVAIERAQKFLAGETARFNEADEIWKTLKAKDEFSLARRVVLRMLEKPQCLSDGIPSSKRSRHLRERAMLTSKDPELSATTRHDQALKMLAETFDYIEGSSGDDGGSVERGETLGIAGGICKRRWNDLGQLKDLLRAAEFYQRGAKCDMGDDAYPHINAAFVEDLLAEAGDRPQERRKEADDLRARILEKHKPSENWFNAATRAEAWFGLKEYEKATDVLRHVDPKAQPALWELRTTAEQLAQLAHIHAARLGVSDPLTIAPISTFFETLLPGAPGAIRSVMIGKVGLALSGGGFRASFYHLGVLACLAERDVLRDVEVLSCVSGGSIVGACYWLKLRQKFKQSPPQSRNDYIQLVCELISHFQEAVETDPRRAVQPWRMTALLNFARGAQGVLDPEEMAQALEKAFYGPLWETPRSPGSAPIWMHELVFQPIDHDATLTDADSFNPGRHNWLRSHKVPGLILNATTVNTGHAWHFTPTWMGESPWAIHESADSIRRLEWSEYDKDPDSETRWRMELSRAVAASACVPTIFEPLRLPQYYKDIEVSLVDGGVHDNQGTVALLASNCNMILVSDACGQLMLEPKAPTGVTAAVVSAKRSMDTLMERVRLANFSDLDARRRSGLLRGLMFLHMKAGLDANVIRLDDTAESYDVEVTQLTPLGVRRDFQQALAELRTDLDAFSPAESLALMACGYQMAGKALDSELPALADVWQAEPYDHWPFKEMRGDITRRGKKTGRSETLLTALRAGQKVRL